MKYSNCTVGQMRLSGGNTGRVEICYSNAWFGVCADNYNSYNKPSTVCKALGYSSQGMEYKYIMLHHLLIDYRC